MAVRMPNLLSDICDNLFFVLRGAHSCLPVLRGSEQAKTQCMLLYRVVQQVVNNVATSRRKERRRWTGKLDQKYRTGRGVAGIEPILDSVPRGSISFASSPLYRSQYFFCIHWLRERWCQGAAVRMSSLWSKYDVLYQYLPHSETLIHRRVLSTCNCRTSIAVRMCAMLASVTELLSDPKNPLLTA
jgi:hypothetical protein